MHNEELTNLLVDIAQKKLLIVDTKILSLVVLSFVFLVGFGFYLLKIFLEKKIKNSGQKAVIKYENELNQHSEMLKHELHKTARNAELFIQKQHQLYPKLYSKLVVAHGLAYDMEQTGFAIRDFSGFSESEIRSLVNDLHIPENLKIEIISHLPDINRAFDKYKEHLPLHLANVADRSVTDSVNVWVKNELFFSESINILITQITKALKSYVKINKLRLNPAYRNLTREDNNKLMEIQSLLEQLKEKMRHDIQGIEERNSEKTVSKDSNKHSANA